MDFSAQQAPKVFARVCAAVAVIYLLTYDEAIRGVGPEFVLGSLAASPQTRSTSSRLPFFSRLYASALSGSTPSLRTRRLEARWVRSTWRRGCCTQNLLLSILGSFRFKFESCTRIRHSRES